MSEWKEYRLGDIVKFYSGGTPSKSNEDFWGGQIPWISASSMEGYFYSDSKLKITESGLKNGSRLAPKNSLLLLVRGSILHQKIQVGIAERDVSYNQDVKCLQPNEKIIDSLFLLFWFKSEEKNLLNIVENTGIGAGKLDTPVLQDLIIRVPPKNERERLNKIFKSIQDKLELNRQMNQTLEAMAQALFKSWFVDFDPVMDNALQAGNDIPDELQAMAEKRSLVPDNQKLLSKNPELAGLFPSSFVFNETLGKWIPEGWEVKKFGDVAKCYDNKRIPLSKKEREEKQPGSFPYYGATSINDYINDYIFDDTYLLLGEDGSVMREDGTPFTQYVWGKIWVNNHAHVLQGKNGVSTEHLLTFIRNEDVGGYVTGAVQLKINQGNMNRIPFLFAKEDIHHEFAKILDGIYSKYKLNHEKTVTLNQMRDTLLPELISGRVRVPMEIKNNF